MKNNRFLRTAEFVNYGHPDKAADQISDAVLTIVLNVDENARTAIETLIKGDLVIVTGEMKASEEALSELDVESVVASCWERIGYDGVPSVINHIKSQSPEIDKGITLDSAVGAGDQGIMCGYATNETDSMMPVEYDLARKVLEQHEAVRLEFPDLLRTDAKSQVTVDEGGTPVSYILSTQHFDLDNHNMSLSDFREFCHNKIIVPALGSIEFNPQKINGAGAWMVGGTRADAGLTGRKIVVDAYGPKVPVGGGAFSGKDPSKVDRSAAYFARFIAKSIVANQIGGASEASVSLAYGIGQSVSEAVSAFDQNGNDLSSWVREHFDVRPQAIIERLDLKHQSCWTYLDTASSGHFGRLDRAFPWEHVGS